MVTFRYIDSKTEKSKTRTVTGEEFLWLLMLHVLPKGFRKTRCYGFLHPCSKKIIKLLQLILHFNPIKMLKKKKPRASIICKCCGSKMEIIQTMIPATKLLQHIGSAWTKKGDFVMWHSTNNICLLNFSGFTGNGLLRSKNTKYRKKISLLWKNRDFQTTPDQPSSIIPLFLSKPEKPPKSYFL